jgi:hypothetical protein
MSAPQSAGAPYLPYSSTLAAPDPVQPPALNVFVASTDGMI